MIFSRRNRINAFINNAFYLKGNSPEEMTDNDFNNGIEGTLTTCFKSIKTLIPVMKNQGYGKIINVSSMYGVVAPDFSIYDNSPRFLNPPHYGAAKAGLVQLTKYYASYLGKYNINVNAVSPGPFPSDSVQKDVGFIKKLQSKTALKRIGKPSDLGGVFTFLCSDASNYITGQNIVVDGGWTSL
jgi:gluconate 5-dehydrogenase